MISFKNFIEKIKLLQLGKFLDHLNNFLFDGMWSSLTDSATKGKPD